jgi:hypothetical protein
MADEPPVSVATAKVLFSQAEADEQAGRWEAALGKLRRASTAKLTPGIRFHIALCEENLGQLAAALADYSAAQDAARTSNNLDVLSLVSERILAIKVRVPTLAVALPAGLAATDSRLQVRVDGRVLPSARIGAPVPVDVGLHVVEASLEGQPPFSRRVTLAESQAASVTLPFSPPPVLAGPTPVVTPAPAPPSSEPAQPQSRTLPIVATVGAVVLVAGGIGAFAAAGADQTYYQDQCKNQRPPCAGATIVRTWDALALTAWVAGGAAAVTAVVLWTRPGPGGATTVGAGPGSLWVAGHF